MKILAYLASYKEPRYRYLRTLRKVLAEREKMKRYNFTASLTDHFLNPRVTFT